MVESTSPRRTFTRVVTRTVAPTTTIGLTTPDQTYEVDVVSGLVAGDPVVDALACDAQAFGEPIDAAVLEVVNATHVLTDLTLSNFEEVHDYLADGEPPRTTPGTGVGS